MADGEQEQAPVDGWLSTPQAAKYGGINPKILERLARGKKIRHGRHGKNGPYRWRREWIDAYFTANGYDGTVRTGGRA